MALNNVDDFTATRRRFVFVINSDPAGLSYTSQLLERFHYKVFTARSAEEAIETASIITPILIITALRLSDLCASDLIRKMKQNKSTSPVAVIVLTSQSDPVEERACLAAGAVTCLPINGAIENLYRVIQMAVEPVPRMNIRIQTKLPVAVHNRVVDCAEAGCLSELSEQGAFIRTRNPYPMKARIPLLINLAGSKLAVEAEVIYNSGQDGKEQRQGMALQFVQISQQDQLRIRAYIRQEITKEM